MKFNLTAYRFFNSIYWLALSLWLGALVMVTITAAVIFPTMRHLNVTIPDIAESGFLDDHWRIAAGHMMEILFLVLDLTQLICATVVLFVTALQFTILGVSLRRFTHVVRIIAAVIAAGCVCWHVFGLSPRMNRHLRAYWDAAIAGDTPAARVHQQAFDDAHPQAARLLGTTATFVALVIISSAAGVVPLKPASEMDESEGESAAADQVKKGTGIQEPELLRTLGI